MAGNGSDGASQVYSEFLYGKSGQFSRKSAERREEVIFRVMKKKITELALNRFKWDGFPPTVDVRFLEMSLLFNGLAVAYIDKDYDQFLVVRATGTGSVNMVDNPVAFTVFGPGSYAQSSGIGDPVMFRSKNIRAYLPMTFERLSVKQKKQVGVPIWPNYLRSSDVDMIDLYASRLATIERSLEINSKNARRNKVLTATPNTQLSVMNFNRQLDEGVDGVIVTAPLGEENAVQALDLGITPDSYDKLSILRTRWWNECMGMLGIDNANQDKKERLVASEVGANDGQTDSMRYVSLNARRIACEQIKAVFGYDITVEFNVEVEAQAKMAEAQMNSGAE